MHVFRFHFSVTNDSSDHIQKRTVLSMATPDRDEAFAPSLDFFDSPLFVTAQQFRIPVKTTCVTTCGMAASTSQGLLALSLKLNAWRPVDVVYIYAIQLMLSPSPGLHLEHVKTISPQRGPRDIPGETLQMRLQFTHFGRGAGKLAFTDTGPLQLLVTDVSDPREAAQVIDMTHLSHAGHLPTPQGFGIPSGVACRGAAAAVSFSKATAVCAGADGVALYQRTDCVWAVVRRLGTPHGQWHLPAGLCFSRDGDKLAVTNARHLFMTCRESRGQVGMFQTSDGAYIGDLPQTNKTPCKVVECDKGWVTLDAQTGYFDIVTQEPDGDHLHARATDINVLPHGRIKEFVVVPGLGLVTSIAGTQPQCMLYVVTTPDFIAMNSMSANRVAWMGAVVRGTHRRRLRAVLEAKRAKTGS